METLNKQTVTIDLRKENLVAIPQFIQGDTNILEFIIKENGADADLSNVGRVIVNYRRTDRNIVSRSLDIVDGVISYKIGQEEMDSSGIGELELQFFSIDNSQRISTLRMKVNILTSIGSAAIQPSDEEVTLLQELFIEVEEKGLYAQTQGDYALEQGNYAFQVADENKQTYLAPVQTFANLATTYPNPTHGDRVQTISDMKEYRYENGAWKHIVTHSSTAVADVQSKILQQNTQTKTLALGSNAVTSDQQTPLDVTSVKGRTVTTLGNTQVDVGAIGHTTTADFAGKVSGSTVENPHVMKYKSTTNLATPSLFTSESAPSQLTILDGNVFTVNGGATANYMAEILLSFNIIAHIERKYAITVPGANTAEKVQWCKDNVSKLTGNVWAKGSGPSGNKVTLVPHTNNFSYMETDKISHNNGTITKLSRQIPYAKPISEYIDSSGFVHFLAYAEPSDGVTASKVEVDYASLDVELNVAKAFTTIKSVTSPKIENKASVTSTADFVGKVSGSVVENPHTLNYSYTNSLPSSPSGSGELSQIHYDNIKILNGGTLGLYTTVNNGIAKHIYSYNIVAHIERKYGKPIPKNTFAEKVQWCKDNLAKLTGNVWAKGSSPSGNKVSFSVRDVKNNRWTVANTHTNNAITKLFLEPNYFPMPLVDWLDSDGFVHFLVYAEPSDGVTASTVETDYTSLDVELKPTAEVLLKSSETINASLHGFNSVKDEIVQNGEGYEKIKRFEEVVLDGSLAWVFQSDQSGFKRVIFLMGGTSTLNNASGVCMKYNGKSLTKDYTVSDGFRVGDGVANNPFYITLSDIDTGWGESYTPTSDEIKAYFNGWKMVTDGEPIGTSVYNGTGTKGWVEKAKVKLQPTDVGSQKNIEIPLTISGWEWEGNKVYEPYKLVYQRATEERVTVTSTGTVLLDKGDNNLILSDKHSIVSSADVKYEQNIVSVVNENTRDIAKNKAFLDALPSTYAKKEQSPYIRAVLQNGWKANGLGLHYMKDEFGFVHLRGEIKDGTQAQYTVFTTLPAGYRPKEQHRRIVYGGGSAKSLVYIEINVDGTIKFDNPSTSNLIGLTGVVFKAEN